jgi:Ca-activated chloride channel family protein
MSKVAALTGGAVFDARSTPLSEVFKEIRGYQ